MNTVSYEADDSGWPLCIDYMRGEGDGQDGLVERYNEIRLARLQRGIHVQLVDAREGRSISPTQRKLIAAFNREHRELQALRLAGVAFVSNSVAARGYITAVYWVSPPSYPHCTFSDMDKALAWARERLQEKVAAAGA